MSDKFETCNPRDHAMGDCMHYLTPPSSDGAAPQNEDATILLKSLESLIKQMKSTNGDHRIANILQMAMTALIDAEYLASEGISYTSEYFREKWDMDARLNAIHEAMKGIDNLAKGGLNGQGQ